MALTRPKYSQIYDTDWKQSVEVATVGSDVGNLIVGNTQPNSIDGVSLSVGSRILVKDQSHGWENGIYRVVSAGTGSNGQWVRAYDASQDSYVTAGLAVSVAKGTANGAKEFKLTTLDPITLGVTSLTFIDPFSVTDGAGLNTYVQFNDNPKLGGSPGFTFTKASNAVVITGNITVGNIITAGIGQFSGQFNESSTTSGVFVGNTGSGTPSPRIGFFNGTASQNWQIDNYFGSFRWFTPGVTRMTLDANGNLSIPSSTAATSVTTGALQVTGGISSQGSIYAVTHYGNIAPTAGLNNLYVTGNLIPSANAIYNLGSPTARWKTGYLTAATLDLDGSTISVDPTNGFEFQVSGSASPIYLASNGALSGSSITASGNIVATSGWISAGTLNATGNVLATAITTSTLNASGNILSTGGVFNALTVNGNETVTGYLNVTGNVLASAITGSTGKFNSASAATSATSGALQVIGGAGIGGDVWIAGNLYVGNVLGTQSNIITVEDPLLYLTSLSVYPYNYDIGFYSHFIGGPANVYAHTGLVRNDTDNTWRLFSNVAEPIGGSFVYGGDTIYDALITGTHTISSGYLNVGGNILATGGVLNALTVNGNEIVTGYLNVTGNIISTGAIHNSLTVNGATTQAGTLTISSGFINSVGNVVATGGVFNALTINGTATATTFSGAGTSLTGTASSLTAGAVTNGFYTTSTFNLGTTSIAVNRASGTQSLTGINIDGSAGSATTATTAGTVTTAAQPNITSVGTLTSLAVGAITSTGYVNTSANISAAIGNFGTLNVGAGSVLPFTTNTATLGSSTLWFTKTWSQSVNALYADLAENYASDKKYVPGTVLVFGGSKEVTISTVSHDPAIAGVVSTDPAYLMNADSEGVAVALQGRVPTRVKGPVSKGDRIVASDLPGVACKMDKTLYEPGCIIGKALEDILDDRVHTIEVVVGRV